MADAPVIPSTAAAAAALLDTQRWQPGLELLDWRDRLFALLYVATDGDAIKSYRVAYDKTGVSAEKRAYALLDRPEIIEALQIIRQRAAAALAFTLDDVLARLQAIADANMSRFVEIDADGAVTFDLRTLAESDWRAVKSLTVKGRGKTQEIKLELHDAAAALTTLGRHFGMGLGTVKVIEDERKERNRLATLLGALSDDELDQLAAVGERLEALGKTIDGQATTVDADQGADQEGRENDGAGDEPDGPEG